ncbi:MAG TPA: tryptophan 2,3-dioxygenase family protein, partial [Candidatus Acidoferrum sp.]|nr:tryptophan 2,3-dioxygenase family protein [Candidatus Acidoferrum sp.]
MANEMHKPVLEGKGATDYERYLRTDDLLSLQTVIDDLSHPDELTFQVVHQSSELLMKGASWELERARVALTEGNYPNSARLMRRADAMLEHPISLLHILETITPYDYHIIRAGLGHGSGLDSPGFLALLHIAPRIGEAFQEQLRSKGLTVHDIYRRHEEFFGLHDVAERMLDFDERL